MIRIGKIKVQDELISFWCPGCEIVHSINVGTDITPNWSWNGSVVAPTFAPSILVTGGHFVCTHNPGDSCWCTYNAKHADNPSKFKCFRCHSFVTEGRIQFLADSSHRLAGKTVDLGDWKS